MTAAPAPPTPGKIVVADDDQALLHTLTYILKGKGYDVVAVPGGENLVESATQRAEAISYLNTSLRGAVPLRADASGQVYARYVKPR